MHDLSLYLLEVLENSTRAGASRVHIELVVDHATDRLCMAVDDDGQGLTATPEQTLDPFYTTKPGKRTGLGLSLLKADAQAAGGDLRIGPSPSLGGVRVEASMRLSHLDRPPLGDVSSSIVVTVVTNPAVTFTVSLEGDEFDPPLDHAPPLEAAARLGAPDGGREPLTSRDKNGEHRQQERKS
jgi:signal transduction histidine kinase